MLDTQDVPIRRALLGLIPLEKSRANWTKEQVGFAIFAKSAGRFALV